MPKPKEQKRKIGRNDPCWCGRNRKYKDCHLPIEQAQLAEQRKLREAQDLLMPKIIDATQTVPAAFPDALERFWKGKYSVEQMSALDDLEDRGSSRFLTWFAFDYVLEDGRTLVETLAEMADHGTFEVDTYETRLLHAWTPVRLRPYIAEKIFKGKGFLARDLLDGRTYEIHDHGAAKKLKEGEIVVGHLVPVDKKDAGKHPLQDNDHGQNQDVTLYSIAGPIAHLTDDTKDTLVEFAHLHLQDVQRTQPNATWDDLIKQRSEVLNHFVIALPVEEYNPTLLDHILLEARVALQFTKQSVEELMGKKDDEQQP